MGDLQVHKDFYKKFTKSIESAFVNFAAFLCDICG